VLDKGEIVDCGTRAELLERGGLFAKLQAEALCLSPPFQAA
jgi:ABC-type multidrug transport system fused ATPase/permease subunit